MEVIGAGAAWPPYAIAITVPTAARESTARTAAATIRGRRKRVDIMHVTLTVRPRLRLRSRNPEPVRITLKEQTNMDQAVIP
ncbi:hypothetical protein GCM10009589_39470 [Arthrobacter pascens]